ncbi:MAG: SDR family oxidoreductase [Actinomycetes bacterium]
MTDFSGKTLVLTGAAGAIGGAIASQFARAGANLVLADVSLPSLTERWADFDQSKVVLFEHDAASSESNDALIALAVSRFGAIDFLVPAAGIYPEQSIAEMTNDQWHRAISVNLDGVFYITRAAIPHLAENSAIVNLASVAGHRGSNRHGHYAATKGALLAFTRGLTWELGSRTRVNAVSPGIIDTPMTIELRAQKGDALLAQTPLARFGTSDEVASVVVFLCSPAASFVNGETIQINGGMHMI